MSIVTVKNISECALNVNKIAESQEKLKDELPKTISESVKKFDQLSYWYGEVIAVIIFIVLQSVVSSGEYSGYSSPPMYGDFEAQRHWMEITVNLPLRQWYLNGTDNDLNYWGLDYPPLTAYHSWLLGKISEYFNPSWVALSTSRGIEQPEHKLFMRLSVMLTMLFFYAPAILLFSRRNGAAKKVSEKISSLVAVLCYPGLIFVDNGHFQYNHITLGLFLWSVLAFQSNHYSTGSLIFVLALNFKQMALYYALPVFVFLLSRSISRKGCIGTKVRTSFFNLLRVAGVVLGVFLFIWAPFLFSVRSNGVWIDFQLAAKVLRRIFPIYRGVFEDKVANFWCCISVLVKVKQSYSNESLAMFSAVLVFVSSLPSLLILLKHPSERNFRLSLMICSLSFYLFSFQVHEKSILLAAVPTLLCLHDFPAAAPWLLSVSLFSLYPLCIKDGMAEILPLFFTYHLFLRSTVVQKNAAKSKWIWALEAGNLGMGMFLCFLLLFAPPPIRYPHLFELLNVLFSFAHFSAFWLWINCCLLQWNCFSLSSAKTKTA